MLRTALKPRWLGLFAVLVLILVSFTRLGFWQLDVARDRGQQDTASRASDRPVAELGAVIRPHAAFPSDGSGRRVRATGTYAAEGQLLVGPRRLEGRTGYWVVTPLVVDDGGARLPVVRGFMTEPAAVPPPAGTITVTGSLAPGESPAEAPDGVQGDGGQAVLGSIDLAVLVNRWPGELYNAFVFSSDERAGDGSGGGEAVEAAPLERVPAPPTGGGGLKWRNTAYALQWWIFAAFAAYMWFRMVRDDADQDKAAQDAAERETTA